MRAVSMAAQARSPTAAKAMPGADIQAFCDPVTTRSRPHASISKGTAPRALIASTRMSASGVTSRIAAASSGIGFVTPVEVSLWVRRTARAFGSSRRAARTSTGSAARPHSTSRRRTSAPYTSATFANRSPNAPVGTATTRSPGERTFTTAVSRAPVPAAVSRRMSARVPKNGRMRRTIRSMSAANSGPRWLIICRPPASMTVGGRAVGPGIRRFCSKRGTGRPPAWSLGRDGDGRSGPLGRPGRTEAGTAG